MAPMSAVGKLHTVTPAEEIKFAGTRTDRALAHASSVPYKFRFPAQAGRVIHQVSLVTRVDPDESELLMRGLYGAALTDRTLKVAADRGDLAFLDLHGRHFTWSYRDPGTSPEQDWELTRYAYEELVPLLATAGQHMEPIPIFYNGYMLFPGKNRDGKVGPKQISATIEGWAAVYAQQQILIQCVPEISTSGYQHGENPVTGNGPPVHVTVAAFTSDKVPSTALRRVIQPLLPGAPGNQMRIPGLLTGADLVTHRHHYSGDALLKATDWLGYIGFGQRLELVRGKADRLPQYMSPFEPGIGVQTADRSHSSGQVRPLSAVRLENRFRSIAHRIGAIEGHGLRIDRLGVAYGRVLVYRDANFAWRTTGAAADVGREVGFIDAQLQIRGRAALANKEFRLILSRAFNELGVSDRILSENDLRHAGEMMLNAELICRSYDNSAIGKALERCVDSVLSESARQSASTGHGQALAVAAR